MMALLFAATLSAQVEDDRGKKMKESQNNAMSEYERFKQQAMQEYNDFRKKANQEYAKFMAEAWKFYPAKEAEEMLETVRVFFRNDLNLTATSKQLFIHRNTLNYRLDKIRKETGLDLRSFEDAVIFRIIYGFLPGRS